MQQDLEQMQKEAEEAALSAADSRSLYEAKTKFLGRTGLVMRC